VLAAASWLPQASIQLVGHVCCRYAYLDECLTLQFHYRTGAEANCRHIFPCRRRTAKLAEQFPTLEEGGALEELVPKKDKLVVAKRRVDCVRMVECLCC
jgi:hypothetical protein